MADAPSTIFTWKISQLERETQDGFVFTAHYTVEAVSGDQVYRAGAYGSIGLERPEGEMVPFSELSEELCVQWVKDKLGVEQVEAVETALQGQLNEQRSPSKAAGMPWAN